jgi:hypothetical protein
MEYERQQADARMKMGKADPMEHVPHSTARDKAGERMNVSGRTVDHAITLRPLLP